MPLAFKVAGTPFLLVAAGASLSSLERSSVPFEGATEDFFSAFLAPADFGLEGWFASSAARRAAFSAFFAAAASAFAAAASLRDLR